MRIRRRDPLGWPLDGRGLRHSSLAKRCFCRSSFLARTPPNGQLYTSNFWDSTLALVAYVLYRIIGVVPIVLKALGWKSESLTNVLGTGATTAISVFIGVASLILWFVVLKFVFAELEAKPN